MSKTNLLKVSRILYPALVVILVVVLLLALYPPLEAYTAWLSPSVALALGLFYALVFGATHPKTNKIGSKWLLQYSVVGLGFGMNIVEALESSQEGMMLTIVSVFGTLFFAWLIGIQLLHLNRNTTRLLGAGTAICGGSAIAAVVPIIQAKEEESSVALGTVFILNALALFIFPTIGEWLSLSQEQFGTWAAIAIHDTSSVVGAGKTYGETALEIATTVKLTRALWIVPLSLFFSLLMYFARKKEEVVVANNGKVGKRRMLSRLPIPLFIIFFIVAIIVNTYILSDVAPMVGGFIKSVAKQGLTLSLFFIGASLTRKVIVSVGPKAMLLGVLLWVIISVGSLLYIIY